MERRMSNNFCGATLKDLTDDPLHHQSWSFHSLIVRSKVSEMYVSWLRRIRKCRRRHSIFLGRGVTFIFVKDIKAINANAVFSELYKCINSPSLCEWFASIL